MSDLLLGLLAAFAAAGLYSGGIALQALEARALSKEHTLRFSLFRRLAMRPRWLLGIVLDLGGWALQTVALGLAPLTVVQPSLAVGLIFLLVIGARGLHEDVGRREVLCVLGIAAGVAGLGWAAPHHGVSHDTGIALVLALSLLGVLALAPYALHRLGYTSGVLIALAAGLAFAWDGLATKFFSDDLSSGAFPGVVLWLAAMFIFAGFGALAENSALQSSPVTQVSPLVFATTTVLPVVLAPFVAGEGWSHDPLVRSVLIAALVLVLVSAATLARSRAVAAVMLAEASSAESETGRSPDEKSRDTVRSSEVSAEGPAESSVTTTIAPERSPSVGSS
jgi:drug/metabolite transporter (DMT)-like permease